MKEAAKAPDEEKRNKNVPGSYF